MDKSLRPFFLDVGACAREIIYACVHTYTRTHTYTHTALFPRFKEARYTEVELGPGEALYIPRGHWHYVRALTASFSVSFWWR